MINETEFRARVKDIERRIPEAFAEDPCYFFESAEECKFYKEEILQIKKKEEPVYQNTIVCSERQATMVKWSQRSTEEKKALLAKGSPIKEQDLEKINSIRLKIGAKPLDIYGQEIK